MPTYLQPLGGRFSRKIPSSGFDDRDRRKTEQIFRTDGDHFSFFFFQWRPDDASELLSSCYNCVVSKPRHGLGRRRGGAVAMREGAARAGGARDTGAAPTPDRLADDQPGETGLHDVRDVQLLAGHVAHQAVQIAEQVCPQLSRGAGGGCKSLISPLLITKCRPYALVSP